MADRVRLYAGTHEGLSVLTAGPGDWKVAERAFDGRVVDSVVGARTKPERVYVGVPADGVYRTDDAGKSWSKVFDVDVRSLAIDPTDDDVIYVGTEPVHLYRSEDRGGAWEELTGLQEMPDDVKDNWWFPRPPNLGHILNIFVHPDDPNTLYLAIEHGGIVRSFDRGETWEDVSGGIDYLDIHFISSLPGSQQRYFVATARGFFRSDDPAKGWGRAENGFTRDYFHDFVFFPARQGEQPALLIATADKSPGYWDRPEFARSALFRSVDAAESWRRVGQGLEEELKPMVWGLVRHPDDADGAFAGLGIVSRGPVTGPSGSGAIYQTRDRGDSWEKVIEMPGERVLWAAPD